VVFDDCDRSDVGEVSDVPVALVDLLELHESLADLVVFLEGVAG
jgi:hypothetical protein